MKEKTIGLNDFAVFWDVGDNTTFVIEENISQERAMELLEMSPNHHIDIWMDGHWEFFI